jgi:hypothetical protein
VPPPRDFASPFDDFDSMQQEMLQMQRSMFERQQQVLLGPVHQRGSGIPPQLTSSLYANVFDSPDRGCQIHLQLLRRSV